MNITLRQLRAFMTVAECGSFTEAAQKLCLTQSALSLQVRQLEIEIEARVFDRETRVIELTGVGRELYPHAKRIFEELTSGLASVSGLREKQKGSLRVAAAQLMACSLLPRVISEYRSLYPNVKVSVQDALTESLLQGLHAGDVELAIGPYIDVAMGINRISLFRDRHWLVFPRDHPLAEARAVTWEEVTKWPFISPTMDFVVQLRRALEQSGQSDIHIEPAYEVSYITTALGFVSNGLGITAVPSFATPLVRQWNLEMRQLVEPVFYRELCIYASPHKTLSPAAESFISVFHRHVEATADMQTGLPSIEPLP